MFDELISTAIKGATVTASGVGGLFLATADIADDRIFGVSITAIRDIGSFGLVTIFVLGILWGIRAGVPAFLQFLRETRDGFFAELKNERDLRERNAIDISAKLNDVKSSIDTGNKLTSDLVNELKHRPCQK